MNLKLLSTKELDGRIKSLAQAERELLNEVVLTVKEIDSRKMYFDFGYSSLYEYLVDEVKYLGGTAQRRIDAARLMKDVPDLGEKIKSGEISLGQITLVQKAIRKVARKNSVKVTAQEKAELIQNLTNLTEAQSEQEVSSFLNLPIVKSSKKTKQADGSTRHEFTLSPEVEAKLLKAQALLSHAVPTQDVAEFLEYLCDKVIQQKTSVRNKSNSTSAKGAESKPIAGVDSKTNVKNNLDCNIASALTPKVNLETKLTMSSASKHKIEGECSNSTAREAVNLSISTKKTVMNNQQCCQYRDPKTGRVCGSTWFTQVDHRQSQWAGGSHEIKNLQVLCAAHNQEKYRKEVGIRFR
jgi:HNH endonuclease.